MRKKEWWERSQADKKRISNWVLMNKIKEKQRKAKERIEKRNAIIRLERKKAAWSPIVYEISNVKDTPHSLTVKFIEWRTKNAKS